MRLLLAIVVTGMAALAVASAAFAHAEVTTSKGTFDTTGSVLTCPDENVVFTGTGTFTVTSTVTPSGQRTATFLFNFSGVSAVGATSGTQYRVVGVTATGFTFSIVPSHDADTFRAVQTWLLIPQGGGAPLSFHDLIVAVFNAEGELTAFVFSGPSDCN